MAHFIGNPDAHSAWGGFGYLPGGANDAVIDRLHNQNFYFSVAALKTLPGDKLPKRRKSHFARLLALAADDAQPDSLVSSPSWVLQTSPGKCQIGVLLDADDPDCANVPLIERVLMRMARNGLIAADPSGNSLVRYIRGPKGQNQKPRPSGHFNTQLTYWRPDVRYTLEDACAVFGIDLDEVKIELAKPVAPGTSVGPIQGDQEEKLRIAASNVVAGIELHESINILSASLVASGAHGGAVVNVLRALMEASHAPKDQRWQDRFADIPRSVSTAEEKFRQAPRMGVTFDAATGEIVAEELFTQIGDLLANVRPIEFLIDQYLETNAISMIFGPSGVGKSFVAIDMACCIATGTAWHKMAVRPGAVFYIAGEGQNGLARRMAAWSMHYGVSLTLAPLFVSRRAVMVSDETAIATVESELDRLVKLAGRQPALIIIDTLARNFGEGDENAAKDMNKFIGNVDSIRRRFGAHVMVVHHSGHDSERARGSSALRAALDQEFLVAGKMGHLELKNTKMKDAEVPVSRNFKVKPVVIGTDPDGIEILGATVVPDGNPFEFEVGLRADGSKIIAGDIIKALLKGESGYETAAVALSASARTVRRAIERCQSAGLVEKDGRWWNLTEEAMATARNMAWV